MSDVKQLCEKYLERMINLREKIHMYPEEGFKEFKTSQIIVNELEKLRIKVQKNVAETGVVALIEGHYPGKTILLRADMDALKIYENNYSYLLELLKENNCDYNEFINFLEK